MEAMWPHLQELRRLIFLHPVYFSIGFGFILLLALKLHCKYSAGMCRLKQDMDGKTVLITGASSGIGKETAMDLAKRNARVLMACRNFKKANKVAHEIKVTTGNKNVFVKILDLSSFESVRNCANSVLNTEDKLHVLINNAGIIGGSRQLTKDGCEQIMQINHFGHFLLTMLLLDLLKKSAPSRIINVSSAGHKYADFDVEDLKNELRLNSYGSYYNSKLANILFTKVLAKKLTRTGVTVNACHPGYVKTDIMKTSNIGFHSILIRMLLFFLGKTPVQGAQTTLRLAIDPDLQKTTGKYFSDCFEVPASKKAEDKEAAERMFEVSERTVGYFY